MSLLAYGLIALAILGAIGGIGYKVRESGYDACKLEWDAAKEKQRAEDSAKETQAETKLEAGNAKSKIVYRTITKAVDKVVDRVEYRDVCLDPDGLRLANDALRGEIPAVDKPDGGLPGPGADGGWKPSGGPAENR